MSFNQSKSEKSKAVYRKTGRSASFNQHRGSSASYVKAGGGGGPASSLSSTRSFNKKSNNAQGEQSTPLNSTEANSTIQNGTHLQPQLHGASDMSVTTNPSESSSAQRSSRIIPKAPTSQLPPPMSSDSAAPITPAKGDASKAFPFQFGSISPGFMNGMAIPGRTRSSPPNIDEQKRDQAHHDSFRSVPSGPAPPVPKQQQPSMKDTGVVTHQFNAGETHIGTKGRKDPQVPASTPAGLTQKPSVVFVSGISMPMSYHQSPESLQFGGPNPQIQSQGMSTASLQMPLPIPIPIGNAQMKHVFIPGLQSHPMHHQGIMHQGHNMSFTPPMGHLLSHQLGNMGIGISRQYPQQHGGKFATPRKTTTVKITHPKTHEELRLDKKTDAYSDGGTSGVRSQPNIPFQSQAVQSLATSHHMNSLSLDSPPVNKMKTISKRKKKRKEILQKADVFLSRNDNVVTNGTVSEHSAMSDSQSADLPEPTSIHVKDCSENAGSESLSLPVSGNKDKTSEPNKVKTSKGKKKRKEILQKAYAAGSMSDLYNAYKGPEEKKETVLSSASTENDSSSGSLKQLPVVAAQLDAVASEKYGESKAEPDDWEDIADMYPPKIQVSDISQVSDESGGTAKKYSRDFLLKLSKQCADLPKDFEVLAYIAEALVSTNISSVRIIEFDSHSCPGRIVDRPGRMSRMDRRGSRNDNVVTNGTVSEHSAMSDSQSADLPEPTSIHVKDCSENAGSESSLSLPVSGNKDKTSEPNKVKTSKGKKKRKEILQKAYAAGSMSDLYNAYKGPEEKKETVLSSASTENDSSSGSLKQLPVVAAQLDAVASEKYGESKAEPDDWEDIADMYPPKIQVSDISQVSDESGGTAKKYSRDFLLKLSKQCADLPKDFEVLAYIAEALVSPNISSVRIIEFDSHSCPGRIVDRPGRMSRMDRRGSRNDNVVTNGTVSEHSAMSDSQSADLPEPTSIHVKDCSENAGSESLSLPVSCNKDKTSEPNKVKTSKGKKKRKEILQKAYAAGSMSDLYNAYKGPEEKKETVLSSASTENDSSSGSLKQLPVVAAQLDAVASEKYGESKAEPDDWEDIADMYPPKIQVSDISQVSDESGGTAKKYSRDFLFKLSKQCADLPKDFEVLAYIAEALVSTNISSVRIIEFDSHSCPGRIVDRPGRMSRMDRRGSRNDNVVTNGTVSEHSAMSDSQSADLPEPTSIHVKDCSENAGSESLSLPVSCNKDKTSEPNKVKTSKGKKKRKEILQKAYAAGSMSDIYNAYKGPEEKKETVLSSASTENDSSSGSLKQLPVVAAQLDAVASEKYGESKAEPDDWEDIADMYPPKIQVSDISQVSDESGGTAKKYSRDFLLKLSKQCADLPKDFEVLAYIAEALVSTNISSVRIIEFDSHSCPGRIVDRPGRMSRMDRRGSRNDNVVTNGTVSEHSAMSDSQSADLPEPTSIHVKDCSENAGSKSLSLPVSGNKDKTSEPNKVKTSKGKKKRKEILQKAYAAGSMSDLYNAYKGPEEKKETVLSSSSTENDSSSGSLKQLPVVAAQLDAVASEKYGESKAEPDDWEDIADMYPPKIQVSDISQVSDESGGTAKKYSRDFLLKLSKQCADLPKDFEVLAYIAEALVSTNISSVRIIGCDSHSCPGRIVDRPGRMSRMDRRGSRMIKEDKKYRVSGAFHSGLGLDGIGGNTDFQAGQGGNFGVLENPRSHTPLQYAGGILSGPMQSMENQGGMQRNSSDGERWPRSASSQQRGLIPLPTTTQNPLQMMHKAEKKYEVGKMPDEEQAKQRQLKAILNKLTPQNFERLFEQVKEVNIDNVVTLTGVISQIFEKALMEPTFCEMYATFCLHLASELPDFSEDNEKITFKSLLLNKFQEEFERGEREQEEANKADEGEVKQSDEEREERRVKARRRMLGNIRLIGELYKKRMITERVMHECIKKLLGQYQDPDEEDIEALCKLMSTIGEMIDHPEAKIHIDAYFERMKVLSNNMNLSSRVRFMLKDAIDLRKNKWQQRMKVEGPKKIEEVHRDAVQERQAQAGRIGRGPGNNTSSRKNPTDFGPRGSSMLSSPTSPMGGL